MDVFFIIAVLLLLNGSLPFSNSRLSRLDSNFVRASFPLNDAKLKEFKIKAYASKLNLLHPKRIANIF